MAQNSRDNHYILCFLAQITAKKRATDSGAERCRSGTKSPGNTHNCNEQGSITIVAKASRSTNAYNTKKQADRNAVGGKISQNQATKGQKKASCGGSKPRTAKKSRLVTKLQKRVVKAAAVKTAERTDKQEGSNKKRRFTTEYAIRTSPDIPTSDRQ